MLTGIPLDELSQGIPTDADDAWWDAHATHLHNDMMHRLRARRWRLEHIGRDVPRGYAIASGPSPRGTNIQHAVVVKDGELWHDPHPSRAGVLSIETYEVLIPLAAPGYAIPPEYAVAAR